MTLRLVCCLALATTLIGCAAPINRHTATNYYQAGETAMTQGNLAHAREMFTRALINARLGNMGPEAEGQVLAKLGRVNGKHVPVRRRREGVYGGHICLLKGLRRIVGAHLPSAHELAQFSYDIGRYEKAVAYFDQAFPMGISVIEKADPAGYVAIMTDYADALSKTGQQQKSKEALAKAAALEGKEGTAKITKGAEYVRYPSSCR